MDGTIIHVGSPADRRDDAYEIKWWSNVVCVHRRHRLYPIIDRDLTFRSTVALTDSTA